jgi:hypothetical protein
VSRRDEVVRDPSERLYWLQSPVCLERRAEPREVASPPRLFVELACKTGRALSRILRVRPY